MAVSSFAVLSVGVWGCSTEPAEEGAAEEATEDALDLAAEPAASVILPADRGEPPERLRTEDLVEGGGAAVESGDVLVVEYLGWRWSDGGEFASSWGAGEPLRFELGAQEVIPGWERGILGDDATEPLRLGGRRVLVIPPELAYGDRGAGAAIGPDETLVFAIDLVAVNPDAAAPDDPGEGEARDG
jgi:peptidylprolyl isomerase